MRLSEGVNFTEIIDHYWDIEAQRFHFWLLSKNSTAWMTEDDLFLLVNGQLLLFAYINRARFGVTC